MGKNNSKHVKKTKKNNKNHHNKSYKKIAFVVVIVLFIIIIFNIKSNKNFLVYHDSQVILNNENITTNLQEEIIKKNQKIYMSMKDIETFFDKTIYQEEETGLIITTASKKIATLKIGEQYITINGVKQETEDPVIEKDGEYYLSVSDLEKIYNYDLEYKEQSNIITIDSFNKESIKAEAKKNLKVKQENKIFSKVIENVKKGDSVIFISEEDGVAKIRTQNGNIGYVKKKLLDNIVTERENLAEEASSINEENSLEYDITSKDISSFEKREEVTNLILQQAIKSDKMNVKIVYNGEQNSDFERFKIEVRPMLEECGIKINI